VLIWLARFVLGGVGEEVVEYAVKRGGELVQFLGVPVRQAACMLFLPAWRIRRAAAWPEG
jgi:hypothetical protein